MLPLIVQGITDVQLNAPVEVIIKLFNVLVPEALVQFKTAETEAVPVTLNVTFAKVFVPAKTRKLPATLNKGMPAPEVEPPSMVKFPPMV